MAATAAHYRVYALPWDAQPEQEERFRRTVRHVAIAVLVCSGILSLLPLPQSSLEEVPEVPPRFAKLLLEKPVPPPPPVVRQLPEPKTIDPEPAPVQSKPERIVEPSPEPVKRVEQARERAVVAGLLPFADDLAELRDNAAVASVMEQRTLAGAAGAADRVERSLITSSAGESSGGINTASMSRNTGGAGLVGRDTTVVASTVAGLAPAPAHDEAGRPSRSREEIELIFDRNKGAIYALYNRALRREPGLQGKLVLRLTIDPSGVVSDCDVVSSELGDAELERKLIQRIKLFRFPDRDVAPVTTTKPIDFFPA